MKNKQLAEATCLHARKVCVTLGGIIREYEAISESKNYLFAYQDITSAYSSRGSGRRNRPCWQKEGNYWEYRQVNPATAKKIFIPRLVASAEETGCGDAYIITAVAFDFLTKKRSSKVCLVNISNEHFVVILGNIDINKIDTIFNIPSENEYLTQNFDDVWICDPFANIVCKPEEYIEKWKEKLSEWSSQQLLITRSNTDNHTKQFTHPFTQSTLPRRKKRVICLYNPEIDCAIEILARSTYQHVKFQAPVSTNKGRKYSTNKGTEIDWNADGFTRYKFLLVREFIREEAEKGALNWIPEAKNDNGVQKWVPTYDKCYSSLQNIRKEAELVDRYRCGNCGDMAIVGAAFLMGRNISNLEIIVIGNEHQMIAINRDIDSDLQDVNTWGYYCWICDPWAEIVCKAGYYIEYWVRTMNHWQHAGKVIRNGYSADWTEPEKWKKLITDGEKVVSHDLKASCCKYNSTAPSTPVMPEEELLDSSHAVRQENNDMEEESEDLLVR